MFRKSSVKSISISMPGWARREIRQSRQDATLRESLRCADSNAPHAALIADIGEHALRLFEIGQQLPAYAQQALAFRSE